jgi:hypothetical protein
MATTLSFGYVRPNTGDKGATVFTALEDNITQLNDHKHDGVTSDRIDSFNLRRDTVTVPNTGWSASGELYRQLVTFPAGFTVSNGSEWGNVSIRFYFDGGAYDRNELFPNTEYVSDTTFYLYSPVNNQGFTVSFV